MSPKKTKPNTQRRVHLIEKSVNMVLSSEIIRVKYFQGSGTHKKTNVITLFSRNFTTRKTYQLWLLSSKACLCFFRIMQYRNSAVIYAKLSIIDYVCKPEINISWTHQQTYISLSVYLTLPSSFQLGITFRTGANCEKFVKFFF